MLVDLPEIVDWHAIKLTLPESHGSVCADQLQEDGDMAGAATWHRILNAIERLQATKPGEGESAQ